MKEEKSPRSTAALTLFLLFAAVLFGLTPAEASIPRAGVAEDGPPLLALHELAPSAIAPSRFGFVQSVWLLDVESAPGCFGLFGLETRRCEITYARNNPLRFVDPDGRAFTVPQFMASQFARNAQIRGAVVGLISILPNQQATSWIVDSLLGQVLPGSTHEFVENSNAAMIGMAMPIEAPGLSRLSALLKPGGQKVGEELANSNVRALVGTAEEASATFKQLIGSAVPEVMKDGKVLVAKIEGLGTITLREVSSTTPAPAATIEIRVQGLGIREVKFFRTTDDLIKAKTGGEK